MDWRRPICRGRGKQAIAGLCVYELAAIPDRSPLPPITDLCRRYWWVGPLLVLWFIHHVWIEVPQ